MLKFEYSFKKKEGRGREFWQAIDINQSEERKSSKVFANDPSKKKLERIFE